jgi:hypothetical protein
MPIEIDLSPEVAGDWLANASSEATGDFFDQMEEGERNRRAEDAQIEALAARLSRTSLSVHEAETVARTWIEQLDETEYRDIRQAALDDEGERDYLDRLATKFLQRLCEFLRATSPQAQD